MSVLEGQTEDSVGLGVLFILNALTGLTVLVIFLR